VDKWGDILRLDVQKIPDVYVHIKRTNQQWQNVALGHRIKLRGPEVKARTAGYMDQLVKETTEVQLHSNNFS
jgi:PleD family two-component response regulator